MVHTCPQQFRLQAAASVEAAEEGGLPRFEIVANTGVPMMVAGFDDPVVIDLKGVKFAGKKLPIIADHDATRRIGHTEQNVKADDGIRLNGLVSGGGKDAQEFTAESSNGFPHQASVDAVVVRGRHLAAGKTATVNGRTMDGPLIISRETLIKGTSIVTWGADGNTSARIAASAVPDSPVTELIDMTFEEYVSEFGLSAESLEPDVKAKFEEKFAALNLEGSDPEPKDPPVAKPVQAKPKDDDAKLEAARRQKAADEEDRQDSIRKICAEFDDPEIEVNGEKRSLKAHAIRDGWDVRDVELHCRREARPKMKQFFAQSPDRNIAEKPLQAAVARIFIKDDEFLQKHYGEEALNASDDRQYKNPSLHMLMDYTISAAGMSYTGNRKDNAFIRATFEAIRELKAAGGTSTVSVDNVLEDAANKLMAYTYERQSVVWPRICRTRNLSDFKSHKMYRLDPSGAYQLVAPDGTLKHVSLDDTKFTVQADTYGAILGLDRKKLINDDLGAFDEVPIMLARMAAIAPEEEVFATLLSNPSSFFSSGNNNNLTGTGSALSIAALTTAEQTFRDQVDGNGKPILVEPRILLSGTAVAVTARELFDETKVELEPSNSGTDRAFASNPHAGKYEPVWSPYINNTSITDRDGDAITGQSSTLWYLMADPNDLPTINIGFLNGNMMPTLETSDLDFDQLGMRWRSYHDFGVGMGDTAAAVRNTGA